MDNEIYSDTVISRFMKKNLFFNDPILKKHYDNDNLHAFRRRVVRFHKTQSFEKIAYALVTDQIRYILMRIIGDLTLKLNPYGDLIISGGEAFNKYLDRERRIITSDIDTKFVPRVKYDTKYFGKLQAIKLILWDNLGKIAQENDKKITSRLQSHSSKIAKFIGLGFSRTSPHLKRRYTLIKKKKTEKLKGDVFIDVELFALDLEVRYFHISKDKIDNTTLGVLDIPLMRPREFGYEIIESQAKGVTYKNKDTGKLVHDKRIKIAGKRFLFEDVYLMQKLGLRPEKKEKDRQRMMQLSKIIDRTININSSDTIDQIFNKVHKKITTPLHKNLKNFKDVNVSAAKNINPAKFSKYTTSPDSSRLYKQFVHGIKATPQNSNINGYTKTYGKYRFDTNRLKWVKARSLAYVGNEQTHRPLKSGQLRNNIKTQNTLYGYRKNRDSWVPKNILTKSADIPFIGLKK